MPEFTLINNPRARPSSGSPPKTPKPAARPIPAVSSSSSGDAAADLPGSETPASFQAAQMPPDNMEEEHIIVGSIGEGQQPLTLPKIPPEPASATGSLGALQDESNTKRKASEELKVGASPPPVKKTKIEYPKGTIFGETRSLSKEQWDAIANKKQKGLNGNLTYEDIGNLHEITGLTLLLIAKTFGKSKNYFTKRLISQNRLMPLTGTKADKVTAAMRNILLPPKGVD